MCVVPLMVECSFVKGPDEVVWIMVKYGELVTELEGKYGELVTMWPGWVGDGSVEVVKRLGFLTAFEWNS